MIVDPETLELATTTATVLAQNARDIPPTAQENLDYIMGRIAIDLGDISNFMTAEDAVTIGTSLSMASFKTLQVCRRSQASGMRLLQLDRISLGLFYRAYEINLKTQYPTHYTIIQLKLTTKLILILQVN